MADPHSAGCFGCSIDHWRSKALGYKMATEQSQRGIRRLRRKLERLQSAFDMLAGIDDKAEVLHEDPSVPILL